MKRNLEAVKLVESIVKSYNPEPVEDMQGAFEAMQIKMNNHLSYHAHSNEEKAHKNRRNRYGERNVKTSFEEINMQVSHERDGSFEAELIPKKKRNVSVIEGKDLAMYAHSMSRSDISNKPIEDIYSFSISHEMLSADTPNQSLPEVVNWQSKSISECFEFMLTVSM